MVAHTAKHLHPWAVSIRERSQRRSHEVYAYDPAWHRLGQRRELHKKKTQTHPTTIVCACVPSSWRMLATTGP